MLRRMLPVAICAALLVTGCEKKEEKPPTPVRVTRPASRTPAGMVSISAAQPVFIATKPLTIGQYIQYLEGTGQDVPVQWQDVLPGSPEAGRSAVGLTQTEARRCAVWHLKRLPTREEWARAAEVVKPRPYPWNEDGSPVAPSAEVYLVQGYDTQSADDLLEARREKEGLADTILNEYLAEIEALGENLRGEIKAERARRQLAWEEVKPVFFALLDKERGLAQERATRAGRAEAVAVVNALATEKAQLAVRLRAGDLTTEQADEEVAKYGRTLAEARTTAQGARQRLQAALKAAQAKVVELTRAYEQWGAARVDQGLAEIEEMVASAAERPETISLAATAKLRLEAAARRLREASAAVGGLPAVAELKQLAGRAEEQLSQLPDDAAAARLAELRDKMAQLGRNVGQEFLQEKELFADLEGLIDLRARKEAAEARLERLKEAVPPAPTAGEPAAQ